MHIESVVRVTAVVLPFFLLTSHCCSITSSFDINKLSSSSKIAFGRHSKGSPSMMVPLTIKDSKLLARVIVGTPNEGQKEEEFTLAISLSDSKSWLHSEELRKEKNWEQEPFKTIGWTKSKTFQRKQSQIKIQVNGLVFQGPVSEDVFKFGSGKEAPTAILEFLEITKKNFGYSGLDGRLGLGIRETLPGFHTPAAAQLFSQFQEAVFGIYIKKSPQENVHGMLVVGGKDDALMVGPLNSHDLLLSQNNQLLGWIVKVESLLIINNDGTREELPLSKKTATPIPVWSDITLPDRDYTAITDKIFQKAEFDHDGRTFSCQSNFKSLPNIALVLDGVEYVLTPEEYVRPSTQNTYCVLAFGKYNGPFLLGQVFMKKYYTRFNIHKKQLQFAKAK